MLKALTALGGLFTALLDFLNANRLKQAGRDAEARKTQEKVLKDVEKRADALRDTDKLKRVREKFQRD